MIVTVAFNCHDQHFVGEGVRSGSFLECLPRGRCLLSNRGLEHFCLVANAHVNGAIPSLNQDSSFDDDETAVAGTARWGDLPVVASVDSKDGTGLLKRGWDATEEEFQRNLDRAKEALDELSDEAILRDEDLARHAFHQVGAYDGPSVFLYDEHGSVRHRDQVDRLLDESDDLWIVPADVHL